MSQEAKFHETLRKLATIREGCIQDQARLALDLTKASTLDPKMAALLVLGVAVAIGSPSACLQRNASGALAAGASEQEITDSLLVMAPVIGFGRVVSAAPDLAAALGYDIEAALYEPDSQ